MSAEAEFAAVIARELGHAPDQSRMEPGKFVRFSVNGKRSDDSGWALFFEDARGGVFGNWRTGFEGVWQAATDRPLTRLEQQVRSREIDQARRARASAELTKHEEAAAVATAIWMAAPLCAQHEYAQRKNIGVQGLRMQRGHLGGCAGVFYVTGPDGRVERLKGDLLLVPMYGDDRRLWSLQAIDRDGRKSFLKGGCTRGLYHVIGSRPLRGIDQAAFSGEVSIAEGMATAATVHALTSLPVFVAFNAGNLSRVAAVVRHRLPLARVTIAGDVDASGVGQAKAEEAARAIGALVSFPPLSEAEVATGASDWNDYVHLHPEGVAQARQA